MPARRNQPRGSQPRTHGLGERPLRPIYRSRSGPARAARQLPSLKTMSTAAPLSPSVIRAWRASKSTSSLSANGGISIAGGAGACGGAMSLGGSLGAGGGATGPASAGGGVLGPASAGAGTPGGADSGEIGGGEAGASCWSGTTSGGMTGLRAKTVGEWRSGAGGVAPAGACHGSGSHDRLDEQRRGADLDRVLERQQTGALDPQAVDERAVGGAEILDRVVAGGLARDAGVLAGDLLVLGELAGARRRDAR